MSENTFAVIVLQEYKALGGTTHRTDFLYQDEDAFRKDITFTWPRFGALGQWVGNQGNVVLQDHNGTFPVNELYICIANSGYAFPICVSGKYLAGTNQDFLKTIEADDIITGDIHRERQNWKDFRAFYLDI